MVWLLIFHKAYLYTKLDAYKSDEIMKDYLLEVIPIRLFLIVTLVFYHAFCIFSGAWAPIEGYPEIPIYSILDKFSYACLLETFVFISGYIFGYQVRKKGLIALSANNIFIKKFRRLIIPSMLFSFFYVLLLGNITQPITQTLYSLINGVGHMWFLPMLFWCFVGVYVFEKLKIKNNIVLGILFLIMFLSAIPLPFRIGTSFYYLFFFYIGYSFQKLEWKLPRSKSLFALSACLFVAAFILKLQIDNIYGGGLSILKILHYASSILIRAFCAGMGIMLLLYGAMRIINYVNFGSSSLIYLSNCCFGVYLFQQFVLKFIYNSKLPYIIDPYLFPWVSFVVSLIVSIVLTVLFRKTKFGRQIL